MIYKNVSENRRGNQEWITHRNSKHCTHKTKINKSKKHKRICAGHHYSQTSTKHVNKTWSLLPKTGGKVDPNIVLCGKRNELHNTEQGTYMHIIGQLSEHGTYTHIIEQLSEHRTYVHIIEQLSELLAKDIFLYWQAALY